MTRTRLLLHNLAFHWRGNLAVCLGVAVSTAVLTGALLVGSSLQGSLRELTLRQLGWVEDAVISGRFVRDGLADKIAGAAPALLLQGSGQSEPGATGSTEPVRRAGQIVILGVNEKFWKDDTGNASLASSINWQAQDDAVLLNQALADELRVKKGDRIALFLQKATRVPRETLLGQREEVVDRLSLTVAGVASNDSLAGQFNLNPRPGLPRNAFIPLKTLQEKLGMGARVNALLASGSATESLQARLADHLTLEDWGLNVLGPQQRTDELFAKLDRKKDGALDKRDWQRRLASAVVARIDKDKDDTLTRAEVHEYYEKAHPYLALESRQMIIEPAFADAALSAAQETKLHAAATMVYLANSIAVKDGASIPYSVVAALDPGLRPPLGPFLPEGVNALGEDEIVLADWKASPIKPQPGDEVLLSYFLPEDNVNLQEKTVPFRFKGYVPLTGVALDPDLTPEFPGITDKLDIGDWRPPFPFDNKRVKQRDEDYWQEYRTTPKAYINLKRGQELWGSRFGDVTTIRLAPEDSAALASARKEFEAALLKKLDPAAGGLVFQPIRATALAASARSTDFGMYFIGFSSFLIAAALLLVGLLYRLNLDRRSDEIGLLLATGFRRALVRNLLLLEGGIVSAVGAVLGSVIAVAYAWLVLEFFASIWPTPEGFSFLHLHVSPLSFGVGYLSALAVSLMTIAWAVRLIGKVAPVMLLHGASLSRDSAPADGRRRWSSLLFWGSLIGAIACTVTAEFVSNQDAKSGAFFGSGAFFLTAGLTGIWIWMRLDRHRQVHGHGWGALARLGGRNATRNPVRSLLTAGLLASAAFVVVAVDAFRRSPTDDFLQQDSGSGGFNLIAEANLPIYQDITSPRGQAELAFSDPTIDKLEDTTIFNLRLRRGDDASCLNLYRPGKPRLLGVPQSLIERGGFLFQNSLAETPAEKKNPWLLLEKKFDDGSIPVFGEMNTVMFQLHKMPGDTIEVQDETGKPVNLRIVGLLKDSVFQSELLLAEANFLRLYPAQEGYDYFLIQTPPAQEDQVAQTLQDALSERGFVVTTSAARLQTYLAVINAYISTFQALGGLGVLLGALGLAVVLLRSVWERRGELALLRALGYRHSALGWLVFAENSFLLALGLLIGACAALLAVAPPLIEQGGSLSFVRLAALLAVVIVAGLLAGAFAVRASLNTPLLPALRKE